MYVASCAYHWIGGQSFKLWVSESRNLKYVPYKILEILEVNFYRAMHYSANKSAVLRLHVVRPSVCNVGGSGPHRLEILETNCTDN